MEKHGYQANGNTTYRSETEYNGRGMTAKRTEYDADGNVTSVVEYGG